MGEFQAGQWIVRLLLYFFVLFLITNYFVQGAIEYDVNNNNVQFDDPGFGNSPISITGECTGADTSQTIGFCTLTLADDQTSCDALTSCVWNVTNNACTGFSLTTCKALANETTCRLARCTWNTIDVPTQASIADKGSVSSIRTTVNFITGINAAQVKVGLPNSVIYIFSFFFFWIEFIMLTIAFYYLLPFFH